MGLAFTAVADDPSAIFYNPAGLGWQKHFSSYAGGSLLTKVEGDFEGANPFPGDVLRGRGSAQDELPPPDVLCRRSRSLPNVNFGLGIFAPYGLGFRWDDAEQFSGRFIAQNAVIQSSDVNPVISLQVSPTLAFAAGADYRLSKVTLERNRAAINPFTQSVGGRRAHQVEQRARGQQRLGLERRASCGSPFRCCPSAPPIAAKSRSTTTARASSRSARRATPRSTRPWRRASRRASRTSR